MQPITSTGVSTLFSITVSAEGIGGDSFPHVRSLHPLTVGEITNLPETKSTRVNSGKCVRLLPLYLFLQIIHRLLLPNVNRKVFSL